MLGVGGIASRTQMTGSRNLRRCLGCPSSAQPASGFQEAHLPITFSGCSHTHDLASAPMHVLASDHRVVDWDVQVASTGCSRQVESWRLLGSSADRLKRRDAFPRWLKDLREQLSGSYHQTVPVLMGV